MNFVHFVSANNIFVLRLLVKYRCHQHQLWNPSLWCLTVV